MHINAIDYTNENLSIEQWMRDSTITSLGRELVKAGISLRGRTHFPGLDPSLIQLASITSKEVERTRAWRKNLSRIRIEEVLRAAEPTLANAREIKINRDFMFAQAKKLADQKGLNVGPRELTAALISRSRSESRCEVPSSIISTRGFLYNARASSTRCRCPPESVEPMSPTIVSKPIGIAAIS